MSFILGRVFNSYSKSFISDRIFSLTTITSISINHNGRNYSNPNQISHRKIPQPVQIHQLRYFSIDFNDSLYQSVTTNEATNLVINLLTKLHDISGLHWWGTLVATSVLLKLFYSIPCAIYQHKLMAKTELITIQSKPLVTNLKHELFIEGKQKRWTTEKIQNNFKREAKKLMQKIMIDNNIHPFKLVILSFVQIPPWLLMTLSISKLSRAISTGTPDSVIAGLQFPVGGPFWCPDLSMPDTTYILPTTLFLFTLTSFKVNFMLKHQKETLLLKILNKLLYLFAVVVFVVSLKVSAGLSLFWTSNAVFGLAQNLLFVSPRMRRLFRIPKTPSELEKPYSHLMDEIRNKWNSLVSKK